MSANICQQFLDKVQAMVVRGDISAENAADLLKLWNDNEDDWADATSDLANSK